MFSWLQGLFQRAAPAASAAHARLTGHDADHYRSLLGTSADSAALVIVTEGATDPEAYARIVGTTEG